MKQVMESSIEGNFFTPVNPPDSFANVKKYSNLLHDELAKYGLEEHTSTLIALMQQESRGRGGDPMQASESAGLDPNTITDPTESIRYGVKHFQRIIKYGNEKNVDFSTIIQSYNMGIGYIDYIANAGGKHTEELAKQFSMLQVEKNPTLYDCGGDKGNFRYPYCYGDFSYSAKVAKYIDELADSVPTHVNGE
ncbi:MULTISPECIES: lysozyme family protein [Peribacillus]|nr:MULTISPECIES: lysozyme family protein [unclassified Peribacillus]MBK5441678.1 lysozyme family protein [Peribacillus sp. TH24]MBK5458398.1 lysozyme family protein [Peribacillus sp. TH27]MBK5501803.1 lysozyme family protein [Peribacillus sp. TH14]WMX53275.1 lysozyme family protein [Peribacillus sp. R9-11]